MKNRGRYDKAIVCPFYRNSDPYHISCEGVTKETSTKVSFGDTEKVNAYKDKHCRSLSGYGRCLICDMLERKYIDDGK